MTNHNPFRNESNCTEPQKGDSLLNIRKKKVVYIAGKEHIISELLSKPEKDNVYNQVEIKNIVTDPAGNSLPEDSLIIAISWSGLFITSPEQMAHCNYWLHLSRRSNIIFVGQDGHRTAKGAVCSTCASWSRTINVILVLLLVGVLGGVLKAASLY